MKIGSKSRRCCCVENSGYCFKVESCEGSTKCPDNVYLSEAALDWVLKQPDSPPYVILFNEYCCLEVTSSTDDISNRYNIADVSGVIIYSDTENQGGTPIQLYPRADDCEVCEQETGACCVSGRGGFSCIPNKTFDECMAYGASSKWIGGGTDCSPNPCSTDDGCQDSKGVCRDESGEVSICGDPETVSGCASTYSMEVSFPDAVLKSQSGFQCGCIGCDCDCCDNDGFCTTNGTLGGRSHTTTLTFDVVSGKWKSSEKVFGGYLNQVVPYATCNNCPDCSDCDCSPCNFGCPECNAIKLLSWYYTVEVSQIMNQTNFPCGGGGVIPFDCCTPAPCAVWRVAITEYIKRTDCIDGINCGSCSECEDPDATSQTCESDSSTLTSCVFVGGGTHNWYIRQDGCGCPAGLTQSNAHWNPFDPATVPPTDANPTSGVGGFRYYEHCTKCGCDNWMKIINPTHFTPASDYLDNIGFLIS